MCDTVASEIVRNADWSVDESLAALKLEIVSAMLRLLRTSVLFTVADNRKTTLNCNVFSFFMYLCLKIKNAVITRTRFC